MNWIPDQSTLEGDALELDILIQKRIEAIKEDMLVCGYTWLVWLGAACSDNAGRMAWLEDVEHQVSYVPWTSYRCFGFKTSQDALLFKLTWGGE